MKTIDDSITVNVPVSRAYNQWTQFEEFHLFMEGVKEVKQIDDKRLHWKAEIGGQTKEWEAEIFEQIPDQRIAWRSTAGSKNSGRLNFTAVSETQTQVRLHLAYDPEGFTENLGDTLGLVAARVTGDLKRFKEFIESRPATGAWRGEIHGREVQPVAGVLSNAGQNASSKGSASDPDCMTVMTKSSGALGSPHGRESRRENPSLASSAIVCMGPSPHSPRRALRRNPRDVLSSNIPIVPGPARFGLSASKHLRARLLVVDDDACILRLNALALSRSGYEVDTAEDGTIAWDALHAGEYDLMITDHNMPNLTGLELLRKLRAKNMALPVIMASGSLPIDEFDRHPALKPAALLCKPYLLNALVQTVRQVLARAVQLALGVNTPQASTPSSL